VERHRVAVSPWRSGGTTPFSSFTVRAMNNSS
jgi:hypothetical protein